MYKHILNVIHQGVPMDHANKVVILVHGRGGSAQGILPIAQQLGFSTYHAIAPLATHNSWYPYSFLAPRTENDPALATGLEILDEIVQSVIQAGVLKENIVLFGFSQGACLVLDYLASFGDEQGNSQVGTAIAFTGGLIGSVLDPDRYVINLDHTSVWISGGDQDGHVPLGRMEETSDILQKLGARVHLEIYPSKLHSISMEEIEAVKSWLFV